jgi:hypothetical protein
MIPSQLVIVSAASILAITGRHRSLNPGLRDAAAGDMAIPPGKPHLPLLVARQTKLSHGDWGDNATSPG